MQENVDQRENRVMKLFKEIQLSRKTTDTFALGLTDPFTDDQASFLLMNYDISDNIISHQRTNADLKNFLYKSVDYELCTKVKSNWNVSSTTKNGKRIRALDTLRDKMYTHV